MELIVLGSSSRGNGYILKGEDSLVLEAGVNLSEVRKAMDFDTSSIVGVLVSHKHGDHAKYARQYAKVLRTFAHPDVWGDSLETRSFEVTANQWYRMRGFDVCPLHLNHDVPCLGYLIDHGDFGRLLFVTDTSEVGYTIPDMTHIMIECNFDNISMERSLKSGSLDVSRMERILESHLSIDGVKDFLRRQDLSKVKDIVLLHLSDGNSNAEYIRQEIEKLTGIPVYIADKDLKLEL